MDKILKIMGLPKSGTNASTVLTNLNFDNYVCDRQLDGMDFLGWKHALPPEINALNLVEKRCNIKTKFIFCYRDFSDWSNSIINNYSGDNSTEFRHFAFGQDGFLFNTPVGVEFYESIHDYYSQRVAAYQNFCSLKSSDAIMVNFDELKDQMKLLQRIQSELQLTKSFDEFTYLRKKVTFNNIITHIKV